MDQSTGSPNGWAWYFGDENYTVPWTQVTPNAGWTARGYHSSVAMSDGSTVLMGGYYNDGTDHYLNDVWRSTNHGASWTQVNTSAGWSGRSKPSSVAMSDGSIVLMGGADSSSAKNDVWRSTDRGTTWTQVNTSAGWSARYGHSSVAMPDGSIVLMGGADFSGFHKNDVWRSTDNGTTWTQVNASPGWSARSLHSSVVMPNGNIVLMGGESDGGDKNDVWRSIDNGATWTQINTSAEWTERDSHNSVAMPDGSIVLMGGYASGDFPHDKNDVWRSTDSGATWTNITTSGGWTGRFHSSSVAMPDGSIVLMGGRDYSNTYYHDVWQLMPAGSLAQNPSHTYTKPGIYPVALQVSNTSGYNSTQKSGYISVTGSSRPVASFTTNVTSGTAPLAVQFNDTSTNTPTSWVWNATNVTGANTTFIFSTVKNATYTFQQGNYTIKLNSTNAIGSNVSTQLTWINVSASPPVVRIGVVIGDSVARGDAAYGSREDIAPDGWHPTFVPHSGTLTGEFQNNWTPDWKWYNNAIGGDVSGVATYANNTPMGVKQRWARDAMGLDDPSHSDTRPSYNMPKPNVVLVGVGINDCVYNGTLYGGDPWRLDQTEDNLYWMALNATQQNVSAIFLTPAPSAGYCSATYTRDLKDWQLSNLSQVARVFDLYSYLNDPNNDGYMKSIYAASNVHVNNYGWIETSRWIREQDADLFNKTTSIIPVFSANVTSGVLPLTVQFNDLTSVGAPRFFNFSFGDGNLSNTTHSTTTKVIHTYTSAGTYTVSLRGTNYGGTNTTTKPNYIIVVETTPLASFTANVTSGIAPFTAQFNDTSAGSPTSWNWSFGDGSLLNATIKNPVHTYANAGNYTVSLNATNAGGSNVSARTNYITVYPKGDFNTNWRVDIGDVTRVAYMAVNLTPLDTAADFNDDTKVDISDVAKIAWYYVGKIPEL